MRAKPELGGDVVIDSVGYTLWRDPDNPEAGLAWKAVDGTDLLEGDPRRPADESWPFGWAGGMGETIRLDPQSAGYAFSVGWDAHKPGVMRLPSSRVTFTPTRPPADFHTKFWTDKPAGSAIFTTVNATVGATTVAHNMSQTPKAAVIMITGHATAADGAIQSGVSFGVGWADDGGNNGGVSYFSANSVATSNAERSYSITDSILIGDGAAAHHVQGKITSFDATNINITWTQTGDSNEIFQIWLIAGVEVSALVKHWTRNTTDITQLVTGVGFQPECLLHITAADTAAGFNDDARFAIAGVDKNLGHWNLSMFSDDAVGTSDTATILSNSKALACLTSTGGGQLLAGTTTALTADGFNITAASPPASNMLVSTLCLRGLQVKAGATAIATAATNTQDAETIGFTTESFLVFGGRVTANDTLTANASFGMGLVAGTSSVEAAAFHDEDAQATTDTDSLFDTTAAMLICSDTAILDEATCGNIDMETAGWLTWGTESGTAHRLHYLGFAALGTGEDTTYVYCGHGEVIEKMSVNAALTTITEEQSRAKDGGRFGPPAKFETFWHIPWGANIDSEFISVIGAGVDDTYADVGGGAIKALAYETQMDGAAAKLLRAHTTNLIDVSSVGGASASFGGDFEAGDTSSAITKMVDSGTSVFVGKTDGLYRFEQPGIAFPVTSIPKHGHGDAPTHGVGLLAVHGTDAALYNHDSVLFFFDGVSIPQNISPDSELLNSLIENVTHEPVGGEWLETALAGDWFYALYRVNESSTDKTYIMAFYRRSGRWIFHSYNRIDGTLRGLDVIDLDGVLTLWTAFLSEGLIGFYVIGRDGSPYAGRDSIGQGEASTTYLWYGPEVTHDASITNKQLWRMVILTRDITTTCPIQFQVMREDGAVQNVGSTITGDGKAMRYLTLGTNDFAVRSRPVISMTTTGAYNSTTTDPQVLAFKYQVYPRPDRSRTFQIIIDTQIKPLSGNPRIDDAKTVRDTLLALTGDFPPVTCLDPDGNSIQLKITEVRELALRTVSLATNETVRPEPREDYNLHWTIECTAVERIAS